METHTRSGAREFHFNAASKRLHRDLGTRSHQPSHKYWAFATGAKARLWNGWIRGPEGPRFHGAISLRVFMRQGLGVGVIVNSITALQAQLYKLRRDFTTLSAMTSGGCGQFGPRPRVEGGRAATARRPSAQSSLAGDENGRVASTTNMTRALRSLVPLLETSMGISGPCPVIDWPASTWLTPCGVLWPSCPVST